MVGGAHTAVRRGCRRSLSQNTRLRVKPPKPDRGAAKGSSRLCVWLSNRSPRPRACGGNRSRRPGADCRVPGVDGHPYHAGTASSVLRVTRQPAAARRLQLHPVKSCCASGSTSPRSPEWNGANTHARVKCNASSGRPAHSPQYSRAPSVGNRRPEIFPNSSAACRACRGFHTRQRAHCEPAGNAGPIELSSTRRVKRRIGPNPLGSHLIRNEPLYYSNTNGDRKEGLGSPDAAHRFENGTSSRSRGPAAADEQE